MSDLSYHRIDIEKGVAKLTFARPKHNVFNIDMMHEFNREIASLAADSTLKCLVLSGEGASWCAGVEVGDHKPEMAPDMIGVFNTMLDRIESMPVPTIAAVHGACLGGGMEAAIACDIIIASEKALFGQPEIKLAFFPPYAAVRLPELVGPAKAIEICTTGKRYTAKEAKELGFVSTVVPEEAFSDAVDACVGEIRTSSPLIIRLNKAAVKRHIGLGRKEAVQQVSDMFLSELMTTEDVLEGIASFEERRRPVWKNK